MSRFVVLVLLLSCVFGCTEHKELKFENQDLEFVMPAGWVVKQQQIISQQSELVVVQYGKYIPKGLCTFTVYQGTHDSYHIMEFFQEQMKSIEVGPVEARFVFKEPKRDVLGDYESFSSSYEMSVMQMKSQGVLHIIVRPDKAVVVQLQKIGTNEVVYTEGVRLLERTFRLLD